MFLKSNVLLLQLAVPPLYEVPCIRLHLIASKQFAGGLLMKSKQIQFNKHQTFLYSFVFVETLLDFTFLK